MDNELDLGTIRNFGTALLIGARRRPVIIATGAILAAAITTIVLL